MDNKNLGKLKIFGLEDEEEEMEVSDQSSAGYVEGYTFSRDEAIKMMFFFNEKMNEQEEKGKVKFLRQQKPPEVKVMVRPNDKKSIDDIENHWKALLYDLKEYVFHKKDESFVQEILKQFDSTVAVSIPSKKDDDIVRVFARSDEDIRKIKRASEKSDAMKKNFDLGNERQYNTRPRSSFDKSSYAGSETASNINMKLEFKTEEGLKVKIYKDAITKLKVDAIVNAANDTLSNAGGVALAISKAAGGGFERDCKEKIRKHGSITDGDNIITEAGNLPYKAIINAVGPMWSAHSKYKCLDILVDTIVKILESARGCKLRSVAMPPISSGIFGVPKQLCAAMYLNGIFKFSGANQLGSLEEFHIIDIHDEVLDMIIEWYEKWKINPPCLAVDNVLTKSNSTSGAGMEMGNRVRRFDKQRQEGASSSSNDSSSRSLFKNIHGKTNIYITTGSILSLKNVDAVVVSESPYFSGEGGLVKTLLKNGGEEYRTHHAMLKKNKNLQHGNVFMSLAGGQLPFKHVFHVIISRMSSSSLELHLKYIQTAIKNVLQNVDNMKRRSEEISLALPMIGTGGLTDWRLQSCCNAASEAIWNYLKANSHSHIRHIHLVNDNAEITRILRDIFQRHEHREGPPSKVRDVPRNHSKEFEYHTKGLKLKETWKVQKMTDSSVDISKYFDKISNSSKDNEKRGNVKIFGDDEEQTFVSENCVICMCEMTDPVRLNRCKHTFCLECITGFFQTKPSCPVCGFVYGKIFGDQPDDGTASIYIDPTSLPGYDEKQTYVIIYEFPKGRQKSFHPDPGVEYEGFKRRAFLPISKDGTEVLQLLKRAFEQGMAFTIGTSRTTGKEGVITWNDIHHKTSKTGGPTKFGYPDSEYLTRVREELGCKGITDE